MIKDKNLPIELSDVKIDIGVSEYSVYRNDDDEDYLTFFAESIDLSTVVKEMRLDGDRQTDIESAYIFEACYDNPDDKYAYIVYYTKKYLKDHKKEWIEPSAINEMALETLKNKMENLQKNLKIQYEENMNYLANLIEQLKT